MELRIFTEPQQGATYADLLAVAQAAERLGYGGAFFRSDHYLAMNSKGLPGPTDAGSPWPAWPGRPRRSASEPSSRPRRSGIRARSRSPSHRSTR